jgi:hypothetical protein
MSEKTSYHLGTKFLGFILGLVLATINTIIEVFKPNFDIMTRYSYILFGWALFVIVIPLLVFLAEILWRYFHYYSEKLEPKE